MLCSLFCHVVSVINSRVSDLKAVGIFLDNKFGYNLIEKTLFNTEFAESLQLSS